MSEKFITFALSAMLFTLGYSASAQEPAGKLPRIGFLSRISIRLIPARLTPSRRSLPPRFAGVGLHRGKKPYYRIQVCRRET
jgi:hypothetical protein